MTTIKKFHGTHKFLSNFQAQISLKRVTPGMTGFGGMQRQGGQSSWDNPYEDPGRPGVNTGAPVVYGGGGNDNV